jgi:hypothetical protein
MVTNMKNSTNCPMCRGVVDDEPRIHQQLENLTYEDVEDMEHSLTEMTGRNQDTSRAIMTHIASQMAINGSPRLTGHMELGVRGIVTSYVSEIVHDFVHILGEWSNAEGDTPVGETPRTPEGVTPSTPVGDTPTTPEGDNLFEDDIPDPPPYPPVGGTPTTPEGGTPSTPVREAPTTPVRVPEEIHAIDRLPAETLNYIDCIINSNFELNEIDFLHELPEFQIININNVRN